MGILDSGGTRHMSNKRDNFSELNSADGYVIGDNQEGIKSEGSSGIYIITIMDGVKRYITLSNLLYAPNLLYNVVYVLQAQKRSFKVVFNDDQDMGARHRNGGAYSQMIWWGKDDWDGDTWRAVQVDDYGV